MRVDIALVFSTAGTRDMDGQVGDHAALHELLNHILSDQSQLLFAAQLVGQGDVDLPCQLGVIAHFGALNGIPQRLPVGQLRMREGWEEDFRVINAAALTVTMHFTRSIILEILSGPIGCCPNRRPSVFPSDDLHGPVVGRHDVMLIP